jgi:hypothetical protein
MSNEAGNSSIENEYPEMQYEIAGKEAYARDSPVRFQTNGLKFVAFTDGHYEQITEPSAPNGGAAAGTGGGEIDCVKCGGVNHLPSFTCPKEEIFKRLKDALMVEHPLAVATATAFRVQKDATTEVLYKASVLASPGAEVCLGTATADNLCEAINSAWVLACGLVNGFPPTATDGEDAPYYVYERSMADVAREYLTAKGLDLGAKAHLNWNDVASWMGYFAVEQIMFSPKTSPAIETQEASTPALVGIKTSSCDGCGNHPAGSCHASAPGNTSVLEGGE